ncbi:MAG: phosphatase PAP2 family protein [Firmicutes bacterium]|nr:phosphatase PAP2 family protein [Bacillota bacterium]
MDEEIKQSKISNKTIAVIVAIAVLLLAFVIITVLVLTDRTQTFDDRIYFRLMDWRNPALNRILRIASFMGNVIVLLIMALLFELIPKTRHKDVGFKAVLAIILSRVVVDLILKPIFQRERPLDYITRGSGTSFPSGHAISATVFFVTVIIFLLLNVKDKRILIPTVIACVLGPIIVSFCRVYLGAHWMTDVLVGMVLGIVIVLLVHFFVWPFIKFVMKKTVAKWTKLDIIYRFAYGRENEVDKENNVIDVDKL